MCQETFICVLTIILDVLFGCGVNCPSTNLYFTLSTDYTVIFKGLTIDRQGEINFCGRTTSTHSFFRTVQGRHDCK